MINKFREKFKIQNSKLLSYKELISYVVNGVCHYCNYAIDAYKIETRFGWKVDENFDICGVKNY